MKIISNCLRLVPRQFLRFWMKASKTQRHKGRLHVLPISPCVARNNVRISAIRIKRQKYGAHTEIDNNRNSNSNFECQNYLVKKMGAGERYLIHGANGPVFTAKKQMRRRMSAGRMLAQNQRDKHKLSYSPFPRSKNSYFQTEAKCKTFLLKINFICMRIKKII